MTAHCSLCDTRDLERRQLERDLHDGAQQRLVGLAIKLRLLSSRYPADVDAQRLLDEARSELHASLAELRDLARGLHPAVLTDHGIGVALESLVARAPVPVTLTIDVAPDLTPRVATAAYYIVAEALTNVAKHARATTATVVVDQEPGQLFVGVRDDGVGGADPAGGTGMRGLADRVGALGGRLVIQSPPRSGTLLHALIPV